MNCTVDARRRARRCAPALDALTPVAGTDVLAPATDPTAHWTVEATLSTDGVPPCVQDVLSEHGLSIWTAQPRGSAHQLVAIVT